MFGKGRFEPNLEDEGEGLHIGDIFEALGDFRAQKKNEESRMRARFPLGILQMVMPLA